MNPSVLAVRHPRLMATLLATLVIWGGVALVRLPRQEEPVLTWRLANVITRLPGASVERVELLITDVLERYVEEVDEVKHIYSVSRAGLSLIQIELSDEVTVAEPIWQKVRQKLNHAAQELPPGVLGPELDDEIMGTFSQLVAVTSRSASYRELKDHARRLERRLRFLPGTASTALFGTQPEVIQVELDPAKLAAQRFSFSEVARALVNRNTRRPAGRLEIDEDELLVEISGEFRSEIDVREMVLPVTSTGRTVRLGDVAHVRRTTREPPEPLARFDGVPAVVLGVRPRQDLRVDQFGREVGEVVGEFRPSLPPEVQCEVVHDLAQYTRERGDELSQTLAWSMILVLLSAALFMGWREAGIVTAAIPITALIVLVLFLVIGMPLNQMSVMSVIMAFGLLVDSAIIVTDEIHRRVRRGEAVETAASEGPAQLLAPLTVSTLTTAAAFLPIYLLPGGVGQFVQAIPVGLTVCLAASLAVSMTVIPWLCAELKRSRRPRNGGRSAGRSPDEPRFDAVGRESQSIDPGEAGSTRLGAAAVSFCRPLLRGALRKPAWTVLLIVAIASAAATLGLTLQRDFFAPVQRDQFVVDVFAPQGTAVARTAELVGRIETLLTQQEGVVSTTSFIGRNAPLVFYNLESQETYATHFAQLIVRVRDWRETARRARQVQAALNSEIAGADCCVHILEHGAPFVAPFEVRISGPSIAVLSELGRRAADVLAQTPGVRNVRDNYGQERLKLVTQVNEPVARRIGIDQGTVADELQARLDGLVAGYVQEGEDRIGILVRFPEDRRTDAADLAAIYFKPSADAPAIPFSTVAQLVPAWEASSVFRRDRQRTLSVLGYPEFGLTAADGSRRFLPGLAALQASFPAGYRLELGGENEQRHIAESNLLGKAVYAVCAILLLLVAEFRRFRLALLILLVVPLSMGGAMLGLWLTNWPLNFMAIMGLLMLAGVSVNDAVVLVDGFEQQRRLGRSVRDLVVPATLERFNHLVVTTVTTVAGFLPLALSPSLLWPPLAIVMIAGLVFETFITVFGVPAAYVLLCGNLDAARPETK